MVLCSICKGTPGNVSSPVWSDTIVFVGSAQTVRDIKSRSDWSRKIWTLANVFSNKSLQTAMVNTANTEEKLKLGKKY